MGRRGSGSTRRSGELAARAAGNIVLQKGMSTNIGPYASVFLPGEPLPDREARKATVYKVAMSGTLPKTQHVGARLFLPVAVLPQ